MYREISGFCDTVRGGMLDIPVKKNKGVNPGI